IEAVASSLTLASTDLAISKAVRDCHEGYQDVGKQIQHAERRRPQLQSNLDHLSQLPLSTKEHIGPRKLPLHPMHWEILSHTQLQ
ncbi:hypothetical protein K469DRAFT_720699, partial [Zopfia rhizophila CBS 207.26]